MINVVKENTGYYFPIDKVPASNEFILELYSELSLSTITFEDLSGEVQDDYVSIVITTEMCEQISNGEYNYTLYDNTDGEKISIGLIRFDLEECGQTDDEEYVVYQDDFDGYVQAIELTTTAFTENGVYEAQDKGWHEVTVNIDTDWYYTSGYTDGYENGYQAGYTNGYQSGFTDGVSSVPLTSITIHTNGSYTAENGGYNSIVVDVTPEEYVTFTSQQPNSTIGLNKLSTNHTLEYSSDAVVWNNMTTGTTITLTASGDSVYVRGILSADNTVEDYTQFKMTGTIEASGNCNNLWNYKKTFAPLKVYCGNRMFKDCSSLTTTPELHATTLANYCYYEMFSGCTNLTVVSELPATNLTQGCYYGLFWGCTSLTTAPELPATTLADECYAAMFYQCSSLTTPPELPATILTRECYRWMFGYCSRLTTPPNLPAMTLADYCYDTMFYNCGLLRTPPDLPATELAPYCYTNMFWGCRNMYKAPELPATTLAQGCYSYMFGFCEAFTEAPVLPATELAPECYAVMFRHCYFTTPPELPATTLAEDCYALMFYYCTRLTTAPELPATTLADGCYTRMFDTCTNLNYIKCLATDISATDCTKDWVNGVSSTGTFVKNENMEDWTTGNNGIPTNWTVNVDNVPESALS